MAWPVWSNGEQSSFRGKRGQRQRRGENVFEFCIYVDGSWSYLCVCVCVHVPLSLSLEGVTGKQLAAIRAEISWQPLIAEFVYKGQL